MMGSGFLGERLMVKRLNPLGLMMVATVVAFGTAGHAANRINAGQIVIDTALSAEDIESIRAQKRWPGIMVDLDKSAGLDALASLGKLPELRALSLSARNEDLTSFAELPELPRLTVLRATSLKNSKKTPFSLKPLARYRELGSIYFFNTKVTDADALAACTQLREINFYMSEVDSIEFLRSTPWVTSLNLYGIQHTFTSYEPVATLKHLQELNIYMNPQASDASLAPLAQLTRLRSINLFGTKDVSSLNFLANSHELEEVAASRSVKLTDIGALADKTVLSKVDLRGVKIDQIRALGDKPHLTHLNIGDTAVKDLAPLRTSPALQQLDLADSAVVDLAPLAGLRRLESLDLSGTGVSDLRALREVTSLKDLKLTNTPVADLTPLAGLDRLVALALDRTQVKDLTPLHGLHNLRRLRVSKTIAPAQIEALRDALPLVDVTQI